MRGVCVWEVHVCEKCIHTTVLCTCLKILSLKLYLTMFAGA